MGWRAIDVWDTAKQENIAEKDREVEDRKHREALAVENQKNRETRLSDIDSKNTNYSIESVEGFKDSTQIVD